MIETFALSKAYEPASWWRKRKPVTAVADITLQIEAGELFGLLGPNGAGKTTLIKLLATLLLPTSGTAKVDGHDLSETQQIRALIGLAVADERSFFWRITVRQNLEFFAALYGLHGRSANHRVGELLAQMDLQAQAEKPFSHLSSGQRQRLAIARSLLHRPKVLFLDEPTRSLDPVAAANLHTLLRALISQEKVTIFLITHDLAEAEVLCDRVAILRGGQIQAIGRPLTLRRSLALPITYDLHLGEVSATLSGLLVAMGVTALGNGRWQLMAREGEEKVTAVIDLLRQHDVTLQAIHTTSPTLDQLFKT